MRPGPVAGAARARARGGVAPALLLDVQTPAGDIFYWSDRPLRNIVPVIAPTVTSDAVYPILNITQPAPQSRGYSYFLWSSGPGNSDTGNVCTVYYSDATNSGPDNDLVAAVNSGLPVFLWFSFEGIAAPIGPMVVQVTSVGEASPPGQPRPFYYFTYTAASSDQLYYAGSGHPGYTANYQRTLATMTMQTAIPSLAAGDTATIQGCIPAQWDGTWTLLQVLSSGAVFTFDPGASKPATSPIFGTGNGGEIVIASTSTSIAPVDYTPWLLSTARLNYNRSMVTDTGTLVLQNLSGDVLQRDFARIARRSVLEGSLFVLRYYQVDLAWAWLEQHGTLSVGDTGNTVQLNLQQLMPGSDDTPAMQVSESCQLVWGEKRCGATGDTECLYTYASCQVIERFVGIQTAFETNNPETSAALPSTTFNRARAW